MPVNTKEPLYTMEQLSLIKRLRETGITKTQVEYIYDSYDRLDKELGQLYNIPAALEMHAQMIQQIQQLALQLAAAQNATQVVAASSTPGVMGGLSMENGHLMQQRQLQMAKFTPVVPRISAEAVGVKNETLQQLYQSISDSQTEVDSQEFEEFVSQGEEACCNEIRTFVAQNGIKQHQVACLAGICQTYVSRYMKGEYMDMSERSRKTIQKWYLSYKSNPTAVGRAANIAVLLNGANNIATPGCSSAAAAAARRSLDLVASNPSFADLLSCPRRERFVFKPAQLEVLEKRFAHNSYPTYEERCEIAGACNGVAEATVGRKLNDRETVSIPVISNWFANKRKDLKKAAKEGGVDLSSVLMSRRGRPARPNLYYMGGPGASAADGVFGAGIKSEMMDEFVAGENNSIGYSNAQEDASDEEDDEPNRGFDSYLSAAE